ncbi:MAG: hypothetical protein GY863_24660 [bacterium]|nr:hypothetical protein [bacterium]
MDKSKYTFEIPVELIQDFIEYVQTYRNLVKERAPEKHHGIATITYLIQNMIVFKNIIIPSNQKR